MSAGPLTIRTSAATKWRLYAQRAKSAFQARATVRGSLVGSSFVAEKQFRNLAVGLGSDVALVTEGTVSVPVAGIGYRCS
jgi:hypothetical protein